MWGEDLVSYLVFPMSLFPSFHQSGALDLPQEREWGHGGGETGVCGDEGTITVRTSTGQRHLQVSLGATLVGSSTQSGDLECLTHMADGNFLASKDPSTSGQLRLLPRPLAELSLFWVLQNVLPISLPAAHPSITQAFEVGSEVS